MSEVQEIIKTHSSDDEIKNSLQQILVKQQELIDKLDRKFLLENKTKLKSHNHTITIQKVDHDLHLKTNLHKKGNVVVVKRIY
jgi:hypothetical protein